MLCSERDMTIAHEIPAAVVTCTRSTLQNHLTFQQASLTGLSRLTRGGAGERKEKQREKGKDHV